MMVVPVSKKICDKFVLEKHYSHRAPIYWAGFALVENDRIEGVCVFGQPSPPLQKFAFREADIDKIVALIQRGPQKEGGAELLVKQSCSRTLFNIPWKDVNGEGEGILLPCVFHTKCKMLCTVLPRNWRDTYENFVLDRDGNSWLHGERSDLSDDNLSDGADE